MQIKRLLQHTLHLTSQTLFRLSLTSKMKTKTIQKTIHLSFGKNDEDLYNELMRQSSLNYTPISSLVRMYVRDSIKTNGKMALTYNV